MKLFLTSSTITPNLVSDFEEFIGRSSDGLKAAFIPDAGYKIQADDKSWIDEEMQYLITNLNWNVTKVELTSENSSSLEKLYDFDVIFVNGGYSGHLAEVMRKSGFADLLPKLLDHGIVYVGSSAGSCVLSEIQEVASIYFGEPEPDAIEIGGLGLINFEFYPMHDHRWTEDLVDKIKARRSPSLKYYLVRDGQAISIHDGKLKLHGDIIHLPIETKS